MIIENHPYLQNKDILAETFLNSVIWILSYVRILYFVKNTK